MDLLVGVKLVKGVIWKISWLLFGRLERNLGGSTAIEDMLNVTLVRG